MLNEHKRIITDKTTDIEHPISLMQEHVLNQRLRRGSRVLIVPTSLKEVNAIIVTPMNASGAKVIKDGYWSNMVLHSASNSTVSLALTQPTNAASYGCQRDQLMLRNRQLFSAISNLTPAVYASAGSVPTGVSNNFWLREESFSGLSKKYLIVNTQASTATWADVRFKVLLFGY